MALSFPSSPTLNQEYVYNGIVYTYDGTKWIASVVSNVATMTDLGDVVLTTPSTDQIIQYNGSSWTNVAPEFVSNSGDTMSGILNMGGNLIQNLASPVLGTDATTKTYVDAQVANAGYTDADVDTHLNTGTATSGELMSWNGTDYDWIPSPSPELYAENPGTFIAPSATGTNAVAIGSESVSAGLRSVALGDSYASGDDSFATAITNNTSSYGATGFNSVAMGGFAKATGSRSVALGYFCQANGSYSLAAGYRSNANQPYSIALGYYASSDVIGKVSFATGKFLSAGDSQAGIFVLRTNTSNATPRELVNDTQITLPNNSAYAFHGTIVARQQASAGTASAAWKIEGLIRREGSAGTTVLVNSATTVLDNTPAWGMALSANTMSGALKIEVTGAAATNILWVATIHTSEVTYA